MIIYLHSLAKEEFDGERGIVIVVLQLEVVAEDIQWSVGRVHGIRKGIQFKMCAWSCVPTATVMRMIDYLHYMAHQGIIWYT